MRLLPLCVMLTCLLFNAEINLANAQKDNSIYGTHSVSFQPIQVNGELEGCSLIFAAVQADHAYQNGKPVLINGNISINQRGGNMLLGFKIGLKDLAGSPFVRPNFAYMQTKNYSTAKVKQESFDGEVGYRLFAYSLDTSSVMDFLMEMIKSGKVTMAFNRVKGGMDVLVPVDLDVIDAEYKGDKVVRKRSKESLANFNDCFGKLLDQAVSSLNKE